MCGFGLKETIPDPPILNKPSRMMPYVTPKTLALVQLCAGISIKILFRYDH